MAPAATAAPPCLLRRHNSTVVLHDLLMEKLKKFTIQPSKVKLLLSLSLSLIAAPQ